MLRPYHHLNAHISYTSPEESPMANSMANPIANVEIYTWSACPFCRRAKQLLDQKGVPYTEYVLDGDEAARNAMVARGTNGRRSVPQIFINHQHIGGSDDLYALERQGQLNHLLAQPTVSAS